MQRRSKAVYVVFYGFRVIRLWELLSRSPTSSFYLISFSSSSFYTSPHWELDVHRTTRIRWTYPGGGVDSTRLLSLSDFYFTQAISRVFCIEHIFHVRALSTTYVNDRPSLGRQQRRRWRFLEKRLVYYLLEQKHSGFCASIVSFVVLVITPRDSCALRTIRAHLRLRKARVSISWQEKGWQRLGLPRDREPHSKKWIEVREAAATAAPYSSIRTSLTIEQL